MINGGECSLTWAVGEDQRTFRWMFELAMNFVFNGFVGFENST
jgi:hypothetical protein